MQAKENEAKLKEAVLKEKNDRYHKLRELMSKCSVFSNEMSKGNSINDKESPLREIKLRLKKEKMNEERKIELIRKTRNAK
jgi:hypothetical protein